MILAALLGIYFGVSRSLTAPGGVSDEAGVIVPAVTPVASAKPILTPTPTMDEAEVRRLAREEAQALLAKSAPHKAAQSDDDADPSVSDQLTPIAPPAPQTLSKPSIAPPQG
jgi:hypothetical protein